MNEVSVTNDLITIRDYLRWATSRFTEANLFFGHGTESAWDDAVQLLCYCLNLPIDSENNILEARLTQAERERVVALIEERIQTRKPVPYLTHKAWFAGLDFYVDERVIVPRSPIAELIHQRFAPWAREYPGHILDLCTGSGCIAIACALTYPNALVDAVDLDANALAVAEKNVATYHLEEQVRLIESDLFSNLGGQRYDIIVSNPPYVSEEEIQSLPAEYHHEPRHALDGQGEEGLDIVQKILQQAANHLSDSGLLICEVGFNEAHLIARYPRVPFTWVDFQEGGQGVFVLTVDQLREFQDQF